MNALIIIAFILAVFVVIITLQPSEFTVQRSALIPASPEVVFDQVNDLHKWEAWSPWAKIDPTAKTTYEGPPAGVGAKFSWAGNAKIGAGDMTVTESQPHELVRFRLEFYKPFRGTNSAEFTFKREESQTRVTWSMSGKNNFVSKAIGLFMSCDKMIGGQFEKGLADMNKVVTTTIKPSVA